VWDDVYNDIPKVESPRGHFPEVYQEKPVLAMVAAN